MICDLTKKMLPYEPHSVWFLQDNTRDMELGRNIQFHEQFNITEYIDICRVGDYLESNNRLMKLLRGKQLTTFSYFI